jgi:hypothetical protein
MVPAERTVTVAVGHGKKAARHIDAYLRGTAYKPAAKHEVATFDKLNTWYYADAPHRAAERSTITAGGRRPSMRWSAAWTRATPSSRRAAACPAATASSATTASASARTTR